MVLDQEAPGTLIANDSLLSAPAARDLTDQIRTALERAFLIIKAAYKGRAWVALGYSTWDDYVTREFGNLHLRPPREQRQEVVLSLREAGMSVRSIASATQLGRGTVTRELEQAGVPFGTPTAPTSIQGQDGKSYQANRIGSSAPDPDTAIEHVRHPEEPASGQLPSDDVLNRPVSVADVEPLDLAARAGVSRQRVLRMLREFHGSGSAALPMTIKLASQVAGLVSPLTGKSELSNEQLHELAYDVSRGLCVLAHAAATLRESMASGESEAAIKENLRDSMGELDRVMRRMGGST